jgi:alpha-mannosidase
VTSRPPRSAPTTAWFQPPPTTFPHQGWVHNNGITVVAPGLPESEVTPDGTIYITVVRAVGWLSRLDLKSRPEPAGPGLRVPEAQCLGPIAAKFSLAFGPAPQVEAWDAELGLRAVPAGPDPLLAPNESLFTLEGRDVVLTALKPAEHGTAVVARLLNPTDTPAQAALRWSTPTGQAVPVRLDEELVEPHSSPTQAVDNVVAVSIPPHALRSVRVEPG